MMVKICGITNRADALAAIAGGASALGFNFWPPSPRYIEVAAAAELLAALPAGPLKVGLFVNEAAAYIDAVARRLGLDVVQIHGECGVPAHVRVWKAYSVTEGFDIGKLDDSAEAFLLDAPAGERCGGTGETFDWTLVRGVRKRIVLAGGLGPDNVRRAIETVHPWGVDACSRLESAPGKKDHPRMAAFLKAALEQP